MIAREQVEAVLAECTDSTVIRRRVADALLALIAAQPVQQPVAVVGQEPTLIAYAATDLDGRVDVGLTPEIAKKRAGHGCDTVFRLYDIGNTVPAAGVQGDKQTDLARRLLFKANDTNGNQISIMKADLIAICCEANRYYIGMVNWKATAEAKDLPSQPDSGRDAALKLARDFIDGQAVPDYAKHWSQQMQEGFSKRWMHPVNYHETQVALHGARHEGYLAGRAITPAPHFERDAILYSYWKQERAVSLLTSFYGNGCINKTIEGMEAEILAAIAAQQEPKS